MLKKWKWHELGAALMLLAGGIALIVLPGLTLLMIAQIMGGLVIALGVFLLLGYALTRNQPGDNYNFVKGIVVIAVGIFICIKSDLIVSILPVILGIGVTISGLLKLQRAFDLHHMGMSSWIKMLCLAAINIAVGLIVVMNPFSTATFLMQMIGVVLALSGLTDLISTLYVSKKTKEYYVDGEAEELEGETEE